MEEINHHHFSKEDYWRDFYKAKLSQYEWIEHWDKIKDHLTKYLLKNETLETARFLDVGCGLSTVMKQVFQLGVGHVTGLDFNKTVIRNLTQKYEHNPAFKCISSVISLIF